MWIIPNVFDGQGNADIDEIGLQYEFQNDLKLYFLKPLSVKNVRQEEFRQAIIEPLLNLAEQEEAATGLHPASFMRIKERVKQALNESVKGDGHAQGWISPLRFAQFCFEEFETHDSEELNSPSQEELEAQRKPSRRIAA